MRKKADIVQVGLMDPIRDWIFDCGGEIPGQEILPNGTSLYGGYTEEELRQISSGLVEVNWADPANVSANLSAIGINCVDFDKPLADFKARGHLGEEGMVCPRSF